MKKQLFLTVFVCLFATNVFAFDIALGNKALGTGSQGGPGFVLVSELQYYYGIAQNADGKNAAGPGGDISTNLFVNSYVFEYTTPFKIFGAKYAFDVVVPFVGVNVDSGEYVLANPTGLLDLYFEPIILAWTTPHLDSKFILGVNAPTGTPGLTFDHFSFAFSGAFSIYFDTARKWQLSLMPIIEVHAPNQSDGVAEGVDFAGKWGVGYTFGTNTIGVIGYSVIQLTDDTYHPKLTPAGATIPSGTLIKGGDEYVHAVGLQYNKFIAPIKSVISVLVNQELVAANRDKGTRVHVALIKIF